MAENKPKEEVQVKEAKIHTIRQKVSKSQWSVERCLKASKRFDSVEAWEKGAPSSFKAATAHGWVDKCTGHMKGKGSYQRTA
jgi:DNA-binding transcriptional regulator YiaG